MTVTIKRRGFGTMLCRGCNQELDVKTNWRRKTVSIQKNGKPHWNCKCDTCFRAAEKAREVKEKARKIALLQPPPENMECKRCMETKSIKDNWKRTIKKRARNGKPFSDIVCDSCDLVKQRFRAERSLVLNAFYYVRTINQEGMNLMSTEEGHRLCYLSRLKSNEKHGHKFNVKKIGWVYWWFPATAFQSTADLFDEYSSNYNLCKKLGSKIPSNIPKPDDAFKVYSSLAAAIYSGRVVVDKFKNKHSLEDISDMISRSSVLEA